MFDTHVTVINNNLDIYKKSNTLINLTSKICLFYNLISGFQQVMEK